MILMAILCVSLWCLYSQPLCISQQNGLLFYLFFFSTRNKGKPKAWQQPLLTALHYLSLLQGMWALSASSITLICIFPSRNQCSVPRPLLLPPGKTATFVCKLLAFTLGLPCHNPGFCVCEDVCNCWNCHIKLLTAQPLRPVSSELRKFAG